METVILGIVLFVVVFCFLPVCVKRADEELGFIVVAWTAYGVANVVGEYATKTLGFYFRDDTTTTITIIFVMVLAFLLHLLLLKGIDKLIDRIIEKQTQKSIKKKEAEAMEEGSSLWHLNYLEATSKSL